MFYKYLYLFLALLSFICGRAFELKTGDLIFQMEGESDFSKAISHATASYDSIRFIHVGIIFNEKNTWKVIEASPEEGVRIIDLETFIDNSPKINGLPGVEIKRLSKYFPAKETIIRAKSYLGEPYDWWYLPDNGKMYCSELVYESYLSEDKEHIFSTVPMNFRSPDGTMPEFWNKLFTKIGMPVPEGIPGTNPQDLYKDPGLVSVINLSKPAMDE